MTRLVAPAARAVWLKNPPCHVHRPRRSLTGQDDRALTDDVGLLAGRLPRIGSRLTRPLAAIAGTTAAEKRRAPLERGLSCEVGPRGANEGILHPVRG